MIFWLLKLDKNLNVMTKTSTKDVRQMGRGGGFEISDIPGRGEGGGLWKFGRPKISEKNRNSKIFQSSLKLKLEIIIDRDSNMRSFT